MVVMVRYSTGLVIISGERVVKSVVNDGCSGYMISNGLMVKWTQETWLTNSRGFQRTINSWLVVEPTL